jgi:hypothetical protein
VTIISGGIKDNVLPSSATARGKHIEIDESLLTLPFLVNHRIAIHETPEEVVEFDRAVINNPNGKYVDYLKRKR